MGRNSISDKRRSNWQCNGISKQEQRYYAKHKFYFDAKIAFWTGNFPVGKNTCLSSPREGKLDGKSPMHCWPFLSTKIHQKLSLQPAWMAWEKVFRNSEWQWTLPSFTTNYWLNYKRLPTYLPSVTFLWKIFLIAQKWKVFMNRGIML